MIDVFWDLLDSIPPKYHKKKLDFIVAVDVGIS